MIFFRVRDAYGYECHRVAHTNIIESNRIHNTHDERIDSVWSLFDVDEVDCIVIRNTIGHKNYTLNNKLFFPRARTLRLFYVFHGIFFFFFLLTVFVHRSQNRKNMLHTSAIYSLFYDIFKSRLNVVGMRCVRRL